MNKARPPTSLKPAVVLPADWWLRLGHDLRGSITPMRMAVQLLKTGRVTAADQEDALQVIDRQIDFLLAGIDDLSELLRLNSGTFVLNSAPNDLNLVLDIVCGRGALAKVLQARQQCLKCMPGDTAVTTEHDPARVAALIEYLVRKASDHAPPGSEITLGLSTDGSRAHLRIGGAGALLGNDPDVAHVIGTALDPNEPIGARSVLMREIARLNDISLLIDEQACILVSARVSPA